MNLYNLFSKLLRPWPALKYTQTLFPGSGTFPSNFLQEPGSGLQNYNAGLVCSAEAEKQEHVGTTLMIRNFVGYFFLNNNISEDLLYGNPPPFLHSEAAGVHNEFFNNSLKLRQTC